MKSIKITNEAWQYLLKIKADTKNEKTMGELASAAILNNVEGN